MRYSNASVATIGRDPRSSSATSAGPATEGGVVTVTHSSDQTTTRAARLPSQTCGATASVAIPTPQICTGSPPSTYPLLGLTLVIEPGSATRCTSLSGLARRSDV